MDKIFRGHLDAWLKPSMDHVLKKKGDDWVIPKLEIATKTPD